MCCFGHIYIRQQSTIAPPWFAMADTAPAVEVAVKAVNDEM